MAEDAPAVSQEEVDKASDLIGSLLPKRRLGVPNPLDRIKEDRGFLDILDEDDLALLRKSQRFREDPFGPLKEHPIDFYHNARVVIDSPDYRIRKSSRTQTVEFRVSLRDLDAWRSDSTQESVCKKFPFNTDEETFDGLLVPMAATIQLLTSLEELPVEFAALKAGCSLACDYLETQANIIGVKKAHKYPALQSYMELTADHPTRLTYQTVITETIKPREVEVFPLLDGLEAVRLARRAFIENQAIDRGTARHVIKDSVTGTERIYRIVPENHGMADVIKQHAEKYVSKARVFTLAARTHIYLRIPETAFIKAATKLHEERKLYGREARMKDISVFIATKQPGDDATVVTTMPANYDEKFTIKVKLTMLFFYAAATPDRDVFLAYPDTLGMFAPGVTYRDTLLDHYEYVGPPKDQEGPENQLYAKGIVKPLYLQDHLESNEKRRLAVKEGKPDEKSRTDLPYLDILCEQL